MVEHRLEKAWGVPRPSRIESGRRPVRSKNRPRRSSISRRCGPKTPPPPPPGDLRSLAPALATEASWEIRFGLPFVHGYRFTMLLGTGRMPA